MKGSEKLQRAARRAFRLTHLRNEEGMLLILTMVIFLVISSLAATNLINAYLERSLADNQHYATLSLNAADAGIDHGIAWLIANPGAIDYGNPAWQEDDIDADGDNGVDGSFDLDGDGTVDVTYDVLVAFKADEDDLDGDGSFTDIVYFNTHGGGADCDPGEDGCFGFPDSIYKKPGGAGTPPFPVIEITAVGAYGAAGSRTVSLELARNGLNVGVFGAVTGNSNLATGGNITIDGRGHDVNGNLCTDAGSSCSCTDGYPAVTLPCPSGDLNGDGDCADVGIGETGIDSDLHKPDNTFGEGTGDKGFLEDYGASPPNSPDEVLGMNPGDLASMIGTPPVGGVKDGIKLSWYNKNIRLQDDHQNRFGNNEDSFGIVIVHNPNFDPHVWDVSVDSGDPGSGYDVTDPDYDATIDANDVAAYDQNEYDDKAPRTLDLNSNATFKGVVIADSVDKVNGNADLVGALVSLSTVKFGTLGNGSARLMFSCDAINSYTTQAYSTKLAWHRRF